MNKLIPLYVHIRFKINQDGLRKYFLTLHPFPPHEERPLFIKVDLSDDAVPNENNLTSQIWAYLHDNHEIKSNPCDSGWDVKIEKITHEIWTIWWFIRAQSEKCDVTLPLPS